MGISSRLNKEEWHTMSVLFHAEQMEAGGFWKCHMFRWLAEQPRLWRPHVGTFSYLPVTPQPLYDASPLWKTPYWHDEWHWASRSSSAVSPVTAAGVPDPNLSHTWTLSLWHTPTGTNWWWWWEKTLWTPWLSSWLRKKFPCLNREVVD